MAYATKKQALKSPTLPINGAKVTRALARRKNEKAKPNDFIENLRIASRSLGQPMVTSGLGSSYDVRVAAALDSADLWLTAKSVEGFDVAEFKDLPDSQLLKLKSEIDAFLAIARTIPADKPATVVQSKHARKNLEQIIKIVGGSLLRKWHEGLRMVLDLATAAAEGNDWYTREDEKEITDSLLGTYKAPRLLIRTPDNGVVLDPITRFGAGRQGVVDLVVLPTYETAYFISWTDAKWQIVSPNGKMSQRPFSVTTLTHTITHLPR